MTYNNLVGNVRYARIKPLTGPSLAPRPTPTVQPGLLHPSPHPFPGLTHWCPPHSQCPTPELECQGKARQDIISDSEKPCLEVRLDLAIPTRTTIMVKIFDLNSHYLTDALTIAQGFCSAPPRCLGPGRLHAHVYQGLL